MKVKIPEPLYRVETKALKSYLNEDKFRYQKYAEVELSELSRPRFRALVKMCEPHQKIRGVGLLLKDMRAWERVAAGDHSVKPRSVEQFADMATELIRTSAGHRLYRKDPERDIWLAYYVNRVAYHPPEHRSHGYETPPSCSIRLIWEEFAQRHQDSPTWHAEDSLHITPAEALGRKGYFIETEEMRATTWPTGTGSTSLSVGSASRFSRPASRPTT